MFLSVYRKDNKHDSIPSLLLVLPRSLAAFSLSTISSFIHSVVIITQHSF